MTLLATGGTAAATVELVRKLGGEVVGAVFCRGTQIPERPREAARDRYFHNDSVRQLAVSTSHGIVEIGR